MLLIFLFFLMHLLCIGMKSCILDFLFHTFKTINELNDRYLENCNECFISTFGLCAVVSLFSLDFETASLFQFNA